MNRWSCFTLMIFFFLFGYSSLVYSHDFNGSYEDDYLNRVAFPMGGMGAGMICLEGTGVLSHFSLRHQPEIFNEPFTFAAISIKGRNSAKVLEGPVPTWKVFGRPNTGNGGSGTPLGLPRFEKARFLARFPFATIDLEDDDIPLDIAITGWSPFIPTDADLSSLPMAALEYSFDNPTNSSIEAVFSFNARNFMRIEVPSEWGGRFISGDEIKPFENGFILHQCGTEENPHHEGQCAIFVQDDAVVDHCWFRGGWFDSVTMTWKTIQEGNMRETPPCEGSSPGASIYVPLNLEAGEQKTVKLMFAWYVPQSQITAGSPPTAEESCCTDSSTCCPRTYKPWYATRFKNVNKVARYWQSSYDDLKEKSRKFQQAFYASTLPDEVLEAVAANLTILKSPTVMRQHDGRLWAWEGCHDLGGCCYGSCTHVWNYAQAIPHLFPSLERTLRETEFTVSQNAQGHQTFRANLPISIPQHNFHAAVDGQLGGIMKMHREWRISGDTRWLKELWPEVKTSMNYCIETWDPRHKGIIEEPHHNTYDIEFWGPDGMCTGFYLGALSAMCRMGAALGEDISEYETLLASGRHFMENNLFNGDYFIQLITTEGLNAPSPIELAEGSWTVEYSPEALALLKREGPKYQYGNGCISDGVLGFWIARMCGLDDIIDLEKIKSHLLSVYRYNLIHDLFDHVNPQRPTFACGHEGGLLLCTWPENDQPSLPFVYSNEVWTGIEYQVASHLILQGYVKEGLDIVRTCRKRYDGRIRNPFNEYECGHWYARALSSYGLLYACSGIRYDAVSKTLMVPEILEDHFCIFLSCETGFGTVSIKKGEPVLDVAFGTIDVDHIETIKLESIRD